MTVNANPFEALKSLQRTISTGLVLPVQCPTNSNLFVHRDEPAPGIPRITYAIMKRLEIIAVAIFVGVEPVAGKQVFELGYATAEKHRNNGYGERVVKEAIEALSAGINPLLPERGFYVRSQVPAGDMASALIAKRQIADDPEGVATNSLGRPVLLYVKLVD